MDGYQPKMRCNDCTKQNDCKKYKDGKDACKKYEGVKPNPPKTCSNSQTPSYTPPPMPEVKPAKQALISVDVTRENYELLREKKLLNPNILYNIKKPNTKQCTVLSVRDFAILYNIINDKIERMESQAQHIPYYMYDNKITKAKEAKQIEEQQMERLRQDHHYQDLLRIREKLGELNIEVETPSVEVE